MLLDTKIVRSSDIVFAKVDNEVVALSIEAGNCYGLNPVGSRIWELIQSPIQIRDICAELVREYKVEPSVCEQQVLNLLEELKIDGLVTEIEVQ
jgi:hypothetical protein